jgi:hypothetical protein
MIIISKLKGGNATRRFRAPAWARVALCDDPDGFLFFLFSMQEEWLRLI